MRLCSRSGMSSTLVWVSVSDWGGGSVRTVDGNGGEIGASSDSSGTAQSQN